MPKHPSTCRCRACAQKPATSFPELEALKRGAALAGVELDHGPPYVREVVRGPGFNGPRFDAEHGVDFARPRSSSEPMTEAQSAAGVALDMLQERAGRGARSQRNRSVRR